MYGIFTYIWVIIRANVGKYTIHGAYGYIYMWKWSKDSWGIFQQAMKRMTRPFSWSNHKRYRPHRGQATNTMSRKKVKNADRMKIPPGIMDMTWGLFRQDFFGIVFCCLCKSASQGMQFLKDIVKWIAARFLCVLRWVSQHALPHNGCYSCSKRWHWLQSSIFHQSLHPFRDISFTVGFFC